MFKVARSFQTIISSNGHSITAELELRETLKSYIRVYFSYLSLHFWPSKLRVSFSRCKVLWGKGPPRIVMI
jgi:hypothetical protein